MKSFFSQRNSRKHFGKRKNCHWSWCLKAICTYRETDGNALSTHNVNDGSSLLLRWAVIACGLAKWAFFLNNFHHPPGLNVTSPATSCMYDLHFLFPDSTFLLIRNAYPITHTLFQSLHYCLLCQQKKGLWTSCLSPRPLMQGIYKFSITLINMYRCTYLFWKKIKTDVVKVEILCFISQMLCFI